jgi:ABC-2 type transport system ATP-binding protein
MPTAVIRTEGLTKIYKGDLGQKPVAGLEGLDLEVLEGEVFAFLGPNGAGKTTTIKLLTRLLKPTKGKIWIFDRPIGSIQALERIGFLPEQPNLYGYLTGREFLDFIGRLFRIPSPERGRRVTEVLGRVGLATQSEKPIRNYSRGMMQRLGMAQALVNDPDIAILDEPMSSLDPIGRKDFRDLILELKRRGKTVFFSSHILSDAEMVADRFCILNKGRLVSTGTLDAWMAEKAGSVEVTFVPKDPGGVRALFPGIDFMIQGQKVLARLPDGEGASGIVKAVLDNGWKLISVVPQRKNLEEVFLTEIGR